MERVSSEPTAHRQQRVKPDSDGRLMVSSIPRILVLRKAWTVLDAFSPERPELGLQEIRAATKLPATTCLRLVRNLVDEGLLSQVGDRYRVGLTILRWAAAARAGLGLVDVVTPFLGSLRDETGETAGLFVRDGTSRVCIALAETPHTVVRRLSVGHSMPVHFGSPGKVLLAFDAEAEALVLGQRLARATDMTITDPTALREELARIRARGYATSFGEWDADVSGIAAPVFASGDRLVAAIGISAPAQRLGRRDESRLAPIVVEAAQKASGQVAHLAAAER